MARESYQDRTAARLEELRTQLERLRDQIFERPDRFNTEERRQLETLRDQYHRARWQLESLRRADDWHALQPEMDRLLETLERGLEQARAGQQAGV